MEMNKIKTDIDIDVIDRESLLTHFDHIPAIIKKKDNTYDRCPCECALDKYLEMV